MTRRARSLIAAVLGTALALAGAGAQRPAAPGGARQQLIRNEDGWAAALVHRDAAYFRRMLAPGFVYTEDDKVMSREDVLRDAISTSDTVTAAHNEDMVVHMAGPVTGVVTGILVVQGRSGGHAYTHRYRFTDTWVKQAPRTWQIVAAQDYLIPGGRR